MRPGRNPGPVAKRNEAVQQGLLGNPGKAEAAGQAGGFMATATVGEAKRPPPPLGSAGVVSAAVPVMPHTRPVAGAQQHGEAPLLAVVQALVERLGRVGELL